MAKKSTEKRMRSAEREHFPGSRKWPKREESTPNNKFNSVLLADMSLVIEAKEVIVVESELEALNLTASEDYARPNRRLTDFLFHTADGKSQPVEMLEADNLYISGIILPLEETSDRKKQTRVFCGEFGRAESWAISGYDDGLPVIWVSTKIADYHCAKPAARYKDLFGQLFHQAQASIHIYRRLSRSTGGNPELSLDELLNGVVPLMSGSDNFPLGVSTRELLISWGRFIYDQLIGLDETSCKDDALFSELPALIALRDEHEGNDTCLSAKQISSGWEQSTEFRMGDGRKSYQSNRPDFPADKGMPKHMAQVESNIYVSDARGDCDILMATKIEHKRRMRLNSIENTSACRSIRKAEAGCTSINVEPIVLADGYVMFESKRVQVVREEQVALSLTAGDDHPRPNRRLADFIFHDADGNPQPVEMLEVDNIYISGLILPLEITSDRKKVQGVQCEEFGRVESWAISGYEDGLPVIWVSTRLADYECIKPAASYKTIYDLLFGKAHACIRIYERLSKSSGGNSDMNLDQLLMGVVSSVEAAINFPPGVSVRDLILSWGRFLFNELIGLDATSSKDDVIFSELPVLTFLRDESDRIANCLPANMFSSTGSPSATSLQTSGGQKLTQSNVEILSPTSRKGHGFNFKEACPPCEGKSRSQIESNIAVFDVTTGLCNGVSTLKQKGMRAKSIGNTPDCQRKPKQDAALIDFKFKSVWLEHEAGVVGSSRGPVVVDELTAISFTAAEDYQRPNRRLTDFIFHDADGKPHPVEMLEVDNIFISGLILPLEETSDIKKVKAVQCEGFGRVESWAISGYEDDLPVIWVSTKIADYECVRPAASYQTIYNILLGKAHACLEVYKMLSKSTGGNTNMSHDELVGGVVSSISGIMNLPLGLSVGDLIISWGRFIYNQLIGLDATSTEGDVIFSESSVLASLRDESDGQKVTHSSKSAIQHDLDITVVSKSKKKWKRSKISSNAPDTDNSLIIKAREVQVVQDEQAAISLTEGPEYPRPNRRLTDFVFHDADGKPQPIEMLEAVNLYASGLILPLEGTSLTEKVTWFRCHDFGRVESWAISGYEDGIPVIWVSTKMSDYECIKAAASYQTMYGLLMGKAHACLEIHKMLSKWNGGNPAMSLDELVGGVVLAMGGIMSFLPRVSIRDSIITWGRFIYDELIGLDVTASKGDLIFSELPVLAALRDESNRILDFFPGKMISSTGSTSNGDVQKSTQLSKVTSLDDKCKHLKLNRLLKEKNEWRSLIQKERRRPVSLSNKFFTMINKDDLANEYPIPAYHKTTIHETDESILHGNVDIDPELLPRKQLHNWSLYNSELMLISLEFLPMKADMAINVLAYGSGFVMAHDGSKFCHNAEPGASSGRQSEEGIPVFLGAIKEWMIEVECSTVFISVRTDKVWYRLGEPSKQYALLYEPVLKTAKLAVEVIKMLKEQSRISRMSFQDVIKRISRINKDHPAYISSNPFVLRRYITVHGPLILQHMAQHPDDSIRRCAFMTFLCGEVDKRGHTKSLVKKKISVKNKLKFNRRAANTTANSKRKPMTATTTGLIDRIWGEYYSNYSDGDNEKNNQEYMKEKRQEKHEAAEEDNFSSLRGIGKHCSVSKHTKRLSSNTRIEWLGEPVGKSCEGDAIFKRAIIRGDVVAVGGSVLVETHELEEYPPICFVEYMFENSDARKLIHGRVMLRGCQTALGNAANEREVFLTNNCVEFELGDVKGTVVVEVRCFPWGYQHRKANTKHDKNDRQRAEDRKNRGLPMEYFCKSLYWPERGAFFCLQTDLMGLGSGICHSCQVIGIKNEKDAFKLKNNGSLTSFTYHDIEYRVNDFIYVDPHHSFKDGMDKGTVKSGSNVRLKAFVVCHLLEILVPQVSKQAYPECVKVKVRRFFRPEDISAEKAYHSDVREVYYSNKKTTLPIVALKGKCDIRRKEDISFSDGTYMFEHIFFCEHIYELKSGSLNKLPRDIKIGHSKERVVKDFMDERSKFKDGKINVGSIGNEEKVPSKNFLATLDIFAGCGGLSAGLMQAGVCTTKWAIEYEEPEAEAFKLNHPEAFTSINNCNVILRAIMTAGGDADDCFSISEDAKSAAKLCENELNNLPRPGQVDFIIGGPPCQGFSRLNRYNQGTWSKVQCEMIPAYLSFVDYFRPKFFLLENVRNFVSFNKGQVFRLTLASLLEMGYQVRFGILQAGAYGVSQSRKRAFIWAVSPSESLPEWPEPMYVFAGHELKITLDVDVKYAAVRSTASGAPFRAITVRDAIGDLPAVGNGASLTAMEYKIAPISWFQKCIRRDMLYLTDHISKGMNEWNLIRCQRIPKRPGADWRDLPDEKICLSSGKEVKLIQGFLKSSGNRHNQWKGLFGRLDWEGNFPTSVTDPQPMGKVGKCFHPEHDRILTVREYARAQGFPDSYSFAGKIQHKHRQIGNAVPPPLAFALGIKLKEALERK